MQEFNKVMAPIGFFMAGRNRRSEDWLPHVDSVPRQSKAAPVPVPARLEPVVKKDDGRGIVVEYHEGQKADYAWIAEAIDKAKALAREQNGGQRLVGV